MVIEGPYRLFLWKKRHFFRQFTPFYRTFFSRICNPICNPYKYFLFFWCTFFATLLETLSETLFDFSAVLDHFRGATKKVAATLWIQLHLNSLYLKHGGLEKASIMPF